MVSAGVALCGLGLFTSGEVAATAPRGSAGFHVVPVVGTRDASMMLVTRF